MVFYLRMGRACAFFSNKLALFAIGAAALVSGAAHATLMAGDLNGDTVTDAYYDTVLDITWLKNANYAAIELDSLGGYFDRGLVNLLLIARSGNERDRS